MHICTNVISRVLFFFFFFNDTATTEIYTLSLHDALPISFQSRSAAESGYIAVERGGKQSASIEVYEEDQARIEEDRIVIRGTLGEPDSTSAEFGDWI